MTFFELSFVFRRHRRRVFGERWLKFGINIQFMGRTDRMTDGIYNGGPPGMVQSLARVRTATLISLACHSSWANCSAAPRNQLRAWSVRVHSLSLSLLLRLCVHFSRSRWILFIDLSISSERSPCSPTRPAAVDKSCQLRWQFAPAYAIAGHCQ